jgi:hypothetical protein
MTETLDDASSSQPSDRSRQVALILLLEKIQADISIYKTFMTLAQPLLAESEVMLDLALNSLKTTSSHQSNRFSTIPK